MPDTQKLRAISGNNYFNMSKSVPCRSYLHKNNIYLDIADLRIIRK
nr:MAG TPA: hypothetical protein [Caudoviricetes sp.]